MGAGLTTERRGGAAGTARRARGRPEGSIRGHGLLDSGLAAARRPGM